LTRARRINTPPAARYVHPAAIGATGAEGDHDFALDVASEAAPNHLRWIADLVSPHLGRRVLEVGAGLGAITEHIAAGRHVVASDVSDECVHALRERFDGAGDVRVLQADLRTWEPDEAFDSVLMVNVLEHIEDDAGALASLSRFVEPGGTVVVYVPALNGLFGAWDRKVGHFRRYSKWRLTEVMREAGLDVRFMRYANVLAIPGWLAFTNLARGDATGDHSLPLWDRYAVPVSRAIESRVPVPLGTNLLGVGRVGAQA
jgi:SAM-dependent methyltransferase